MDVVYEDLTRHLVFLVQRMRFKEWVFLAMTGWRKVLYCDQGFPDNYIEPELFLADLKKNR